jgi:hypothetical protein
MAAADRHAAAMAFFQPAETLLLGDMFADAMVIGFGFLQRAAAALPCRFLPVP